MTTEREDFEAWFNKNGAGLFVYSAACGYQAGRAAHSQLESAARAVVDRWDTPLWKDVPATAEYINALRRALENTP